MECNEVEADKNIVSLNKRKATLRSKVLVDVLEYWQGLKPEGALPSRSDINPCHIEGALPYAFVLERLAPGVARIRVAGGHLSDLMGMDVRGMPLSAVFQHADRNKLMGFLDRVFSKPRALELELSARGTGARSVLQAEMMALPLLDDSGRVTRALGCLVAQGALPNPPYRFQIAAARETDIEIEQSRVSFSATALPKPTISRSETITGQSAAHPAGFAAPQKNFVAKNIENKIETAPDRVSIKAPFLRVVK